MSSEVVVAAEQLSKAYRVYATPWDRVWEVVGRRARHREFRALQGVSFEVRRGEGLAVVGENGAGKSTLLKILAGITAPTAGRFDVRGKVASILELGSGFHPEFTGRQNIVLNAAMLGLSEEELRRKLPAIVDFSELGDFIDQPVKCYSTGMAMRLGFAIATQVEPDVLIIDEALSVGDGYFQKKCMNRLLAFMEGGGTLLFCSHAMYYVSAFCQHALWLRHGSPEALGPVPEVVRAYESFLLAKAAPDAAARPAERQGGAAAAPDAAVPPPRPPRPQSPAWIVAARLAAPGQADAEAAEAAESAGPRVFAPSAPWELEIEWRTEDPGIAFHLGVGVNRQDGIEVCSFATHLDGIAPSTGKQSYRARLLVPKLPLIKGDFSLYVFLLDEAALHIYDQRVLPRAFAVHGPRYSFGLIQAEHAWTFGLEPYEDRSLGDAEGLASVHKSGARA
jgi:lipopolysaccharide transport system ATP-binding protein